MAEPIYTAKEIYDTIHQNGAVDGSNMHEVRRMLNYDYLHMGARDFDKLVRQIERHNSNPISDEELSRSRNAIPNDYEQTPRDTAQGYGDIGVTRDSRGHVAAVYVNNNHGLSKGWGAQLAGTKVFDDDNHEMLDGGKHRFGQALQARPFESRQQPERQQPERPHPDRVDTTRQEMDRSQFSEIERHIRRQVVDQSRFEINKGDNWYAVASKLEPSLTPKETLAFAHYLKHINGSPRVLHPHQVIITRSPEEIDKVVNDQMKRLTYGIR